MKLQAFLIIPKACAGYLSMHVVYNYAFTLPWMAPGKTMFHFKQSHNFY